MLLNKKSSFVAVGGICSALSIVFLLVASIIPAGKLAFVFASSVIVGMMICAYGNKSAIVHYLSVSVLAVLFLPDKPIAILYAVVVGNYPIIKRYIEHIELKWLRAIVKLSAYNLYMLICYILGSFMLNIDFSAKYPIWILWIGVVCIFALYDYIYMTFVYKAYDLINKI